MSQTTKAPLRTKGFSLQQSPRIYVTALPGKWLLRRATPSWRIADPEKGFQRLVQEQRAREIAVAVLEQRRSFPNAIVLATDAIEFEETEGHLNIPVDTRFMVVDGQHRLWAQKFSTYDATYACSIHTGLTEVEMATLFLEINDTQKRVPSSLRWDLVRLVRPEEDPVGIAATDIIYLLATEEESPLFQRIDLTGEQGEIQLKQGSLAPDIKQLVSKKSPIYGLNFDEQHHIVMQFFIALRDWDPDGWASGKSPFYKARVIRAMLRLAPDIFRDIGGEMAGISATDIRPYLSRIQENSLDPDAIKAIQGNAGIKAIYDQLRADVFLEKAGVS
jgi:DGQHR domain-containing protein